VSARALTIGLVMIFERLWKQTSIASVIKKLLTGRNFAFDVAG